VGILNSVYLSQKKATAMGGNWFNSHSTLFISLASKASYGAECTVSRYRLITACGGTQWFISGNKKGRLSDLSFT